ncbi:Mrr restriction system protein [Tetragenococcus halophilus]|uniref:restriction endonuclease n=1 Tax=Tetragenococcus halophilus TaxID=51669 RepID=UPI001F1A2ACE|nr:Mrr restriction system protein [Tetragenococcus halophilus]MCF1684234.1 Mrr restriction system protein [Tetragenococcus halophilus]
MASKSIERENLIMHEALSAMRSLGGQTTRKEIRREIREHSDKISEQIVDEQRTSKKSGFKYHPFLYRFNFAIKYLIAADFINTEDNRNLELSGKGRSVDLDQFDASRDVRAISESDFMVEKESSDKTHLHEDDEESWRGELLKALSKMHPQKFELFSRGLLTKMGVDIDESVGVQYISDGGLDGFGYITSDDFRTTRVALQAKRWDRKVSSPEIDKFRGAMDKYNAEYGIFITTSDFTREAMRVAKSGTRIITLINGDKICDLVAKYRYYVEEVTTYKLKSFYTDSE